MMAKPILEDPLWELIEPRLPPPIPGSHAGFQPHRAEGHPVRAPDRHPVGVPAPRDRLFGHEVLAPAARLAGGRGVGAHSPHAAQRVAGRGPDRLVPGGGEQRLAAGAEGEAQTGPNPTDRAGLGSKPNVLTDAQSLPLAVALSAVNRHDVTQLLPLVDQIPPIAGKPGPPRRRPDCVQGDRAYDSQPHRRVLRRRGIASVLARRGAEHGSRLGKTRWVVERSLSWLHQSPRLRVRLERRADIRQAILSLACLLTCCDFAVRLL